MWVSSINSGRQHWSTVTHRFSIPSLYVVTQDVNSQETSDYLYCLIWPPIAPSCGRGRQFWLLLTGCEHRQSCQQERLWLWKIKQGPSDASMSGGICGLLRYAIMNGPLEQGAEARLYPCLTHQEKELLPPNVGQDRCEMSTRNRIGLAWKEMLVHRPNGLPRRRYSSPAYHDCNKSAKRRW